MATEWNLRGRSNGCCNCDRVFEDGEKIVSTVAVTAAEELAAIIEKLPGAKDGKALPEYVRLDFCKECKKTLPQKAIISQWQGVYTAPEPPAPEALPRETAESLLRKLIEGEDNPDNVPVIFVLAVMLERKKLLIERTVRHLPDGTLMRIYEHKKNGEVIFITDPNLSLEQIPIVQQRVADLLAPPAPEPQPSAEAEESEQQSTANNQEPTEEVDLSNQA